MSSLAIMAGLDPRSVADLDEDDFLALMNAAFEQERARAWTNTNEQLAAICESLWAILARLNSGLATVQVRKLRKPHGVERFPRPKWVEDDDTEAKPKVLVVAHAADLAHMMKGKG